MKRLYAINQTGINRNQSKPIIGKFKLLKEFIRFLNDQYCWSFDVSKANDIYIHKHQVYKYNEETNSFGGYIDARNEKAKELHITKYIKDYNESI